MTTVNGSLISCGADQEPSFRFTCNGPSCAVLDGFLNMTCNTDTYGTLSCDNGVGCAGQATLQNQFTLSQKGDSERDYQQRRLVTRAIHVTTGNCTAILSSNGMPNGSRLDSNCSGSIQSTATRGNSTISMLRSLIFILLTGWIFFWHAALAYSILDTLASPLDERLIDDNSSLSRNQHGLEKRVYSFRQNLEHLSADMVDYMIDKAVNTADGKEAFAETFQAEIIDACCKALIYEGQNVAGKEAFMAVFLEPCEAVIDGGILLVQPELEILAALSSEFICGFIGTELFNRLPVVGDMADIICGGPKPCSEDLLSDSENCGTCGNKCEGFCEHGACRIDTCEGANREVNRCAQGDNADTCYCASDTAGRGFCVQNTASCFDQLTDDCSSNEECKPGFVCGAPPGCSANVCLDARSCLGTVRPSGVTPVAIPGGQGGTTTTQPSITTTQPSPHSTTSAAAGRVAPSRLDGYDVDVASYDYWFNDNQEDTSFYVKIDGILTVNTRCMTVEETSEGATFPDSSTIPKGTEIMWDPHDSGTSPDTCCFAYYSNAQCGETGSWDHSCAGFDKTSAFDVKSWKVYNCKGRYEQV